MRIAVDAREAYRKDPRGIGKSLIEQYRCVARLRPHWQFLMYHQLPARRDPFLGVPNVEARQIDMPGADRFNLWEQLRLPFAAWTARASVLHCPANTGPQFSVLPLVLTVHDLIPLELAPDAPETHRWVRRVRAAARSASCVITDSEYSHRQIVDCFDLSEKRVIVNHLAVDGSASREAPSIEEREQVGARYGLKTGWPYLITFGAADPRKNTVRLLQAWGQLPEPLRRRAQFLVVGIQGTAQARFRQTADEAGAGPECLLHGFVPESDLHTLLAGARALCYPSLAEGFGLPILEAYWCETAVLTSNRTSLPEVAGDAALVVDPLDVGAIARGLERLLTDDALRADLVGKGCKRRTDFSWDRSAECLAQLLASAGAGRCSDADFRIYGSAPHGPTSTVADLSNTRAATGCRTR
jgi:glycosyltransferase involved in cell wall biosynthesis